MSEALPPIDDELWDEVAAGELDAEELAVLRALAEGDDDVAAFEPLGVEVRERIAGGLVEGIRRQRRRRVIAWGALGVAAAAAVLLWVAVPREGAVPAYAATISAGAAETRATPREVEVPRFEEDTRLELRLTPSQRVEDEVVVSTFAIVDGALVRWSVALERSAGGAARVVGRAGDLLPRGVSALVIVVDREEVSLDEARRRLDVGDPTVSRVALRFEP